MSLRLRFNLRSLLITFIALTLVTSLAVRYWRQYERQRQSVEELIQAGGKIGERNKIHLLYNDYHKWSDDHTRHLFVPPEDELPPNGMGPLEPRGVKGWMKRTFGRDFLYRPVVMVYHWESGTELNFDDEMIELIRSLRIREITLYKSPTRSNPNSFITLFKPLARSNPNSFATRSRAEICKELSLMFPDIVVRDLSD